MRPLLVVVLLLAVALTAAPPASASDGAPDGACTGTVPEVCVQDQNCGATVTTTGAFVCLVRGEGAFDPTSYYLIVCAVEGALYVCVTDDSASTPCAHVEATTVCYPRPEPETITQSPRTDEVGNCTKTMPMACVDHEGCGATVTTTGAFVCIGRGEGVFDSTGYYIIWCAVDGAVHVCYTDDSESTPCVHVEATTLCPFDAEPWLAASAAQPCAHGPDYTVCLLEGSQPVCVVDVQTTAGATCFGSAGAWWFHGHAWAEACAVKGTTGTACVWYDNANSPPGRCQVLSLTCEF